MKILSGRDEDVVDLKNSTYGMTIPTTKTTHESVNMSSEAIDRRLRDLGQLYRFGMSLLHAKRIGPLNQRSREKSRVADEDEPSMNADKC